MVTLLWAFVTVGGHAGKKVNWDRDHVMFLGIEWVSYFLTRVPHSTAEAQRSSVVAPAQRSDSALQKARRKRTKDGYPVHSFRTLLQDLATVCKNRIQPKLPGALPFDKVTLKTPLQQRAFDLLRIRP